MPILCCDFYEAGFALWITQVRVEANRYMASLPPGASDPPHMENERNVLEAPRRNPDKYLAQENLLAAAGLNIRCSHKPMLASTRARKWLVKNRRGLWTAGVESRRMRARGCSSAFVRGLFLLRGHRESALGLPSLNAMTQQLADSQSAYD